jgi:hypothetical protein
MNFKNIFLLIEIFLSLFLTSNGVSASPEKNFSSQYKWKDLPELHSAWLYDGSSSVPSSYYYNTIYDFNNDPHSHADHNINTLFTYGGDIEMYCNNKDIQCIPNKTMFVYYNDHARQSVIAYKSDQTHSHIQKIMPIVDGRVDDESVLAHFNTLPEATRLLADNLAQQYCADNNVDGVQIDLEPFDINRPGQAAFYDQLNKDFTSKNYGCINSDHPNGRYYSNFAYSGQWDKKDGSFHTLTQDQWTAIAKSFGENTNGFFIVSGYDVGPNEANTPNNLSQYHDYLTAELKAMKQAASTYKIHYMVGIPAGASTKEFEQICDKNYHNCTSSGYFQIDYLKTLEQVMNELQIKQDPYYLGSSMWAFNQFMKYKKATYLPSAPTDGSPILNYLASQI